MTKIGSLDRFAAKYPKSREIYKRSLKVSRGMNHDSRYCVPFPIIASHGQGSRKWDVDGNEHIDYSMGHGALLFGHTHPAIVKAVSRQMARGSLFAHEHEASIELAERINRLVPAANRVEFTSSGNEANLLTAQIARAYTHRDKILKFEEDDFGWTDEMNAGSAEPFDKPRAGRLSPTLDGALNAGMMVIPRNDLVALERALSKKDVAALFIEGAEAHASGSPVFPETIRAARQLTSRHGTLLVFDEVITGFRWSPGGWQAVIGVTPDLCSLAKILGGGLPIGAVCGRTDVMELLKIKSDNPEWNRFRKVPHAGSYNGNAVSVAAGNAVLQMAETGEPQKKAEAQARRLCAGMNHEIEKRGIDARASQISSVIHLKTRNAVEALNRHLLLQGVHIHRGVIGWVSALHTQEDIDQTIRAFGLALDDMREEGLI